MSVWQLGVSPVVALLGVSLVGECIADSGISIFDTIQIGADSNGVVFVLDVIQKVVLAWVDMLGLVPEHCLRRLFGVQENDFRKSTVFDVVVDLWARHL